MYIGSLTQSVNTHCNGSALTAAAIVCRPFVVRSVELEGCVCHECLRQTCSYHEVLKVHLDKRTKGMKTVIKSRELAFEAGRILLTTRAYTQQLDKERLCNLTGTLEASEEAVVMEKVDNYPQSLYPKKNVHLIGLWVCAAKLPGMTCHLSHP